MTVTDITFDDATDVTSIQYRLHPLDVGFDLREDDMAIAISDEPPIIPPPGGTIEGTKK